MTKQQILDQIAQLDVSEEIKQRLNSRVAIYPENLEKLHEEDFAGLLDQAVADEYSAAQQLSSAANQMELALDQEELVFNSTMDEIADDAERLEKELQDLNTAAA